MVQSPDVKAGDFNSAIYDQIVDLLVAKTGCSLNEIRPQSDLGNDLGVDGDDYSELIDEYSKRFTVDLPGYRWYFHSGEEGNNIGGTIFRPPYERVKYIPVTPWMLFEYAQKGRWDLQYPEHTLPKRRYDLIFNWILMIVIVAALLYKCLS